VIDRDDAVAVIAARSPAPVVLSCEHASERLPEPWRWPEEDGWLIGTHWSHDIGAEPICRALAARLGAAAVLSRFTRLLADPNRPAESPTLFLERAEGRAVALNQRLADREHRLAYWRAYHDALDAAVAASDAPLVFAIHSFTPLYEGRRRDFELGVLFDDEEDVAGRLARHLAAAGFATRLNEPYSGKAGMIFAAHRHASARGRGALEIEVRQDLAVVPHIRDRLVDCLAEFDFAR
jgi:predicted N-formylglutamate amidohydrolase